METSSTPIRNTTKPYKNTSKLSNLTHKTYKFLYSVNNPPKYRSLLPPSQAVQISPLPLPLSQEERQQERENPLPLGAGKHRPGQLSRSNHSNVVVLNALTLQPTLPLLIPAPVLVSQKPAPKEVIPMIKFCYYIYITNMQQA